MDNCEKTRNQRLAQQLGMPAGTAHTHLKKNILFHLLKKHGENICARCKALIVSVDDLSIEHVKPWENIDPVLFWDMNNIAFSHVKCNKPHRWRRQPLRKLPEGIQWCYRCRKEKSTDEFYSNVSRYNGIGSECKDCRSEMNSIAE